MVKTLTVNAAWTEPGYRPASLYESPFAELDHRPLFHDIAAADIDHTPATGSLEAFAHTLLAALRNRLRGLDGPVHCLLSGGYDSRILAVLLERAGVEPLYVTDGEEEPQCSDTLDLLDVPSGRRYVHDLGRDDPYGLADAACDGFAPLYSQMGFFPTDPDATLVTGLGGGEWFSYPADGWHNGKTPRIPHTNLVNMWLDCWPQYALLPEAWARGYRAARNPYCTVEYARAAAGCRREWLVTKPGYVGLDAVRHAMLDLLDERLASIGWVPHNYDWRLSPSARDRIDDRYDRSWVARTFHRWEFGLPSAMDAADHACTLAGFASWCERLAADGAKLAVAA